MVLKKERVFILSILLMIAVIGVVLVSGNTALAGGDRMKGAEIYAKNCAVCHGPQGQGRGGPMGWFTGGGGPKRLTPYIGNQLANENFLALTDDATLRKMIELGRPGRPMPGWSGKLSSKEIDDVIAFLRSWQKIPSIPLDPQPVWGDPSNGEGLFRAMCSECHGVDGKGTDFGPALNNQGFLSAVPDDFILQTIVRGRPGTVMRPFLKGDPNAIVDLEKEQIEDIVAYIRSWDENRQLEPYLFKGVMGGETTLK